MMKSRATSAAVAFAAMLALWNADAQATAIQLQRSYDNPSPDANDLFGQSVSLSGGIALVGAGADSTTGTTSGQAYLFNSATGALLRTLANPTPAVNDQFGLSVSLSGNLALVGAQNDDTGATNAGAAYLFNASTGALLRTFTNPGPAPILLDSFGHAVAVSGNRALISAPLDDAGATNAGAAYLFDTGTGALLRTFTNPSPAANDQFGSQIALRGNLALIGAFNKDSGAIADSGFVYLFDTNTGALLRTFSNPTPGTNDDFGSSIALSATRVLIGAVQDDTRGFNEGAAYLYDLATGNLLNTLLIPVAKRDSEFLGQSVALSDKFALVGAAFDNHAATDAGGAYLFDANTGALLQQIFDPHPVNDDRFGFAVALDGSEALIGAQTNHVGALEVGTVFEYAPAPVPEPATFGILGAALVGFTLLRRRARSSAIPDPPAARRRPLRPCRSLRASRRSPPA